MKTLTKTEFKELLENNPGKRFAFFENFDNEKRDMSLHITDGCKKYPTMFATAICNDEENTIIFDYDWSLISDYDDKDKFDILEINDIHKLMELLLKVDGFAK